MIDATLDKRFGAHTVLRGATLRVAPGTVHTLVKIVAGVLRGDGGSLVVGGSEVAIARWTRPQARTAGIGIVQQHGAFAGTLTVVENAVLGVEPRRGPWLDLAGTADALAALGTRIGLPIDPWARAEDLSLGAAQRAEIVAALHHGAKLLILDEPTAVLAPVEVDGLLATLRTLARDGTTIVIVTHKLDEVRAVADDVTVLRAGHTVATMHAAPAEPRFDVRAIACAMVGAEPPEPARVRAPDAGAPVVLALDRVSVRAGAAVGPAGESAGSAGKGGGAALGDITLDVRAGELVGVAGVDGNGQRELAGAIAGLVRHTGTIRIGGHDVSARSPAARLSTGLAHIPEDRHHGGLVLDATIADNLALARPDITGRFLVDRRRVARHASERITELDIRPPEPAAIVRTLSGGNQQKVVIARELSRPSLVAVLAAQPTRGVDLGAVARIHDRLRAAAAAGAGVLVISADLDELLVLCHRIVVLLRGRIVGERSGDELAASDARATLGAMMTGAGDARAPVAPAAVDAGGGRP